MHAGFIGLQIDNRFNFIKFVLCNCITRFPLEITYVTLRVGRRVSNQP